jgi:hypothetical protein
MDGDLCDGHVKQTIRSNRGLILFNGVFAITWTRNRLKERVSADITYVVALSVRLSWIYGDRPIADVRRNSYAAGRNKVTATTSDGGQPCANDWM